MDIQAILQANKNLSKRVDELKEKEHELWIAQEHIRDLTEKHKRIQSRLSDQTHVHRIVMKKGSDYLMLPVLEIRGGIDGRGLAILVGEA